MALLLRCMGSIFILRGHQYCQRRIERTIFNNLRGEVNLLFNVTINDISVIYVTAHRCAGGLKLDLRSGSQRNRHLAGFFNDTRRPFLYCYSEKPPHLVAFYDTPGIRRTHSRLNPPPGSSQGGGIFNKMKVQKYIHIPFPTPPSPSRSCHGKGQASLRRWRSILLLNISIGEFVDWHVGRYVGKPVSPQTPSRRHGRDMTH